VRNAHVSEWATWKTSASLIWRWALLALGLHLLWEVGQLPFYTLWQEGEAWQIALYVSHCTLGDALIATLSYLLVALIWRQVNWPRQRFWTGGMLLIAMGLGYTGFSEWYNVYHIGSWAYSEAMPLIYGIGITPLLQWLIVPGVMLVLIKRTRIGRRWQKSPSAPLFIFF
jgi:hypothetical protein